MSVKAIIKNMIKNDSAWLRLALSIYNRLPFNNRLKLRHNTLSIGCSQLKKCRISVNGINNEIIVASGCRLNKCRISITGNNNKIIISPYASLTDVRICIENDNNEVLIGEYSTLEGNTHLACIEGTAIKIGKDCMFSSNISIRTGDSHSITNMNDERINPSKDVIIGDHVWVGNTVLMTKGVTVGDNSIIGTGSVVTRRFTENNIAIAGNPAGIIKTEVSWDRARLPFAGTPAKAIKILPPQENC